MNIETNRIDEKIYTKYLDNLETYYKLKKKYNRQKQSYIDKLITSADTTEVKKKLYSTFKFICVNCKKEGGTIFKETNKMLQAVCGNTTNPCKLNMEIIKLNSIYIDIELDIVSKKIKKIKELIILTKLDYLFKYIDEDRVVEIFNELKTSLSKTQDEYNSLIILYNSIIYNQSSLELLEKKMNEYREIINQILEFFKIYYTTNDKEYLHSSLELYVNKIPELNNTILNLKYKHNNIEQIDDNIYKIIQDKYNLNDLEIIIKPTK